MKTVFKKAESTARDNYNYPLLGYLGRDGRLVMARDDYSYIYMDMARDEEESAQFTYVVCSHPFEFTPAEEGTSITFEQAYVYK